MPPVALVDCNNFYASCERLFQPGLRGRPVVVLSNNDGCVIARSNEAKALGIVMGEPWHLCRDRHAQSGVIVRSSNYTLYGDLSARVMRVLASFTPNLEIYSIDEAFLGLHGFDGRLDAHVRELRRIVLQWTGIPVSIGLGPTKTLAKVANRFAKKEPERGGVCLLLTEAAQDEALARMELTDLWGVASRLAARLQLLGIMTPLDLKQADPRFIRERFNVVLERMVLELRGVACLSLEEVTPDRKSVMASRSFGRAVESRHELAESVRVFTARAAAKMRRQHLAAGRLTVFIETNEFKPADPQYANARTVRLPVASADTGRLIAAAQAGLNAIWRPGFRYKKAGALLFDLAVADRVQQGLFDQPDDARSLARMRALDSLNARFGRGTIALGVAGRRQGWDLRREFISPPYTTDWHKLLRV